MSKKSLVCGMLSLVVLLAVSSACMGERRTTVCAGLVPAQPVRTLLDSGKLYLNPETSSVSINSGGNSIDCMISKKEDSLVPFVEVKLGLLNVLLDLNSTPERLDKKPQVSGGKSVRVGGGKGTMDARDTWVYATCNDIEWYVHVEGPSDNYVPDAGVENLRAMRRIVKSVLNALQKYENCTAGSASPSPSVS